jgi:hypothetical protein
LRPGLIAVQLFARTSFRRFRRTGEKWKDQPEWRQKRTGVGHAKLKKPPVPDPKEITKLKDAIRAMHGCESLHVESVVVKEVFEGQTAWEGKIEVFDFVGHRQVKRVYAGSHREGDQNKTFVVLEIPPVDSPESAVKVAIASKARSN